MFPSLPSGDCFRRRFRVVHLGRDVLALPCGQDARVEVDDVFRTFSDLATVEDDVVMMVVEHEWDVQFLAKREQFMDTPTNVIILEHKTVFDALRQLGVVLTEAGQGGLFVAEDAAEMEDHDGITVLLWR